MSSAGGVADCIITHVVSGMTLNMPMVIVTYETEAKPNWSSTATYGRMDPIFTYQNTVRTFTVVLRTPKGGEKFTKAQAQVFMDANQVGWKGPSTSGRYTAPTTVAAKYVNKIADLYKLMYPTYTEVANRGTGFMTGAPLLRLSLAGVVASGVSSGTGLLFVPETFKVTSLVDAAKPIVTISSAADLRFFANAGGYTITLGGTVLHEDARVGWVIGDEGTTVHFGQGNNFPYNTNNQTSMSRAISRGTAAAKGFTKAVLAKKPAETSPATNPIQEKCWRFVVKHNHDSPPPANMSEEEAKTRMMKAFDRCVEAGEEKYAIKAAKRGVGSGAGEASWGGGPQAAEKP